MAFDLTDSELDELDDLLAQTPEPLDPLDLVMLDGYLCGVLAQPRVVPRDEWLSPVFDVEARPLPDDIDPAWLARCSELIERRMASLNHEITDVGWFDPVLYDPPSDEPVAEDEAPDGADLLAGVAPHSRTLVGWVAGFGYATECFPGFETVSDDAVNDTLDRIFRHLPPENDDDRELLQALDREFPLKTVDDAVEDLVLSVVELWELTSRERFHVETVRRDAPKVGRNDPCPCGSGRKFKHCHGG
jgi:uncharacterized protein